MDKLRRFFGGMDHNKLRASRLLFMAFMRFVERAVGGGSLQKYSPETLGQANPVDQILGE
jgi:hypothetical protein